MFDNRMFTKLEVITSAKEDMLLLLCMYVSLHVSKSEECILIEFSGNVNSD